MLEFKKFKIVSIDGITNKKNETVIRTSRGRGRVRELAITKLGRNRNYVILKIEEIKEED